MCGAGVAPVTRQQEVTLDGMGAQAVQHALDDCGVDPKRVEALYVGNMMSGMLSKQQHLGPLIANAAGLDLVEASTAEVGGRREETKPRSDSERKRYGKERREGLNC